MSQLHASPVAMENCAPLDFRARTAVWCRRLPRQLREYLQFDAGLLTSAAGLAAVSASSALRLLGKRDSAARLEAILHRGAYSAIADKLIERRLLQAVQHDRAQFRRFIEQYPEQPTTAAFFQDPFRMLGHRALVVKSPRAGEKGVLALDYFFAFVLFAKLFDVETIAQRYHLLLEPSWTGYCNYELLCYLGYDFPVFVQTYEPRDIAFVKRFPRNFVPIPVAGNWWVDHRIFRPLPGATRDADVLMIAGWAKYKRHDHVFSALAKLRSRGEKLKTILVGYPGDMSLNDLWRLARYHGVSDQLEIFERVDAEEVNRQLNRVKVNVLWSRREGFNRAIIEGLWSNTPGIMRRGFNYGYEYPYINAQTGSFSTERELPDKLLSIARHHEEYASRHWVQEHMSPQIATRVVDEHFARYAAVQGEPWTTGQIEVKVTFLDGMRYWDEGKRPQFADDYAYLQSMLRTNR